MLKLFRKKHPEQDIKIVSKTLTTTIEEKEAEEKCSAISKWFHKHGKKVAVTVLVIALIASMKHCSCEDNMTDENDIPNSDPGFEQMEEEEKEPIDQIEMPEQDGVIGLEPTETEIEQTPVITPAEPEITPTPVVTPEIKTPVVEEVHEHEFGQWKALDATLEERTCECGATETREHELSYTVDYQALQMEATHVKQVISSCGTCGFSGKEEIEETCHCTITNYNDQHEYLVCDECGRTSTKKHVLDKGTPGEKGSTIYSCTNEGCPYDKVVKERKDKDKPSSSTPDDDNEPDRDHNTDNSGNEGIGSDDKIEFPDETPDRDHNTDSSGNEGIGSGDKIEFDEGSIRSQIKELYVMREIIVNGIVYEGPQLVTASQYTLK